MSAGQFSVAGSTAIHPIDLSGWRAVCGSLGVDSDDISTLQVNYAAGSPHPFVTAQRRDGTKLAYEASVQIQGALRSPRIVPEWCDPTTHAERVAASGVAVVV